MRSGTLSSSLISSSFGGVGLRLALLSTTLIAGGLPIAAHAQSAASGASAKAAQTNFNVPPQALDSALTTVADQGGIRIFFTSAEVAGIRSNGVSGATTVEEALSQVLTGTGFTWRFQQDRTVVIERVPQTQRAITLGPVRVDGTGGESGTVATAVPKTATLGNLPEALPGGQVARGGRLGNLGNVDVLEAPVATTSFTAQAIQDFQARRITDIVDRDPSVRSQWGALGTDEYIVIRGVNAQSFIDGVGGGLTGFRTTFLEPFERVEIIKGPTGLVNGTSQNGFAGGAINLVPKRAADEPIASATATFVSPGQAGVHIDVGTRFGSTNGFGVRVNGVVRRGDTIINGSDNDLDLISATVDYRSDHFRISVTGIYFENLITAAQDVFRVSEGIALPNPPRLNRQIGQSWQATRLEQQTVITRAEYDVLEKTTVSVGYGYNFASENANGPAVSVVDQDGSARISGSERFLIDFSTHSLEGAIRSRFSTGTITHQLTVGGTYQERYLRFFLSLTDQPQAVTSLYDVTQTPRPDYGPLEGLFFQRTKSSSFSIADTIGLFDDKLLFTAGVRRVNIRVDDSYDESRWTPSAAVVFRATPRISIYANYIKGFAQGPTAPNTGVINPGEQFPPVENRQYEFGAKWDMGGWILSSAIFDLTLPNGIIVPQQNSNLGEFGVDGEQRNRGVELSVAGEPLPGLRLVGGFSITDAELTRTQNEAFDGKRPISVARNVVTLNAEYDLPQVPGLTVTGRVLHNSSIPVDQANTQFTDGYVRFDLGARYAFARNLTARLNVENAFQERYFIGSFNAGLLALPAPRTIRFSLTADF